MEQAGHERLSADRSVAGGRFGPIGSARHCDGPHLERRRSTVSFCRPCAVDIRVDDSARMACPPESPGSEPVQGNLMTLFEHQRRMLANRRSGETLVGNMAAVVDAVRDTVVSGLDPTGAAVACAEHGRACCTACLPEPPRRLAA